MASFVICDLYQFAIFYTWLFIKYIDFGLFIQDSTEFEFFNKPLDTMDMMYVGKTEVRKDILVVIKKIK